MIKSQEIPVTIAITSMTLLMILIISFYFFGNVAVNGSLNTSDRSGSPQQAAAIHPSFGDGFTIIVPNGWAIDEEVGTNTNALLSEIMHGVKLVAQLCPEEHAAINFDGGSSCDDSNNTLYIQQYTDVPDGYNSTLGLYNSNMANDYLLDFHLSKLEELGHTEINIVHNTQISVNLLDGHTNKTVTTVPANLLEMRYNNAEGVDTRAYMMLVATNGTLNEETISGYVLSYEADPLRQPSGIPPSPLQEIVHSFQLINQAKDDEEVTIQDQINGQFENYDDFEGGNLTQIFGNISSQSLTLEAIN
ncbi:MAG: hypothetical protein M3115_01230 [Thermoproteota archaeon]|nr:hypothetical protein [Thermoproteota archaeon]